ncbi:MAG: radical SAM protein [Nitrospiraceae bacterium]|nr:radical SAM protein [Nitrospiraceae bacterium]
MNLSKLYQLIKNLHTLAPYYCAPGGHAFPAWHYYLEVTRRCNLRCVMCQYIQWLKCTSGAEQKKGELTTEEWLGVIRQIPRWGLITFTGGEPLVRSDFLTLLEEASAKARVHVISNATLLTEERARRFAEFAPKRLGSAGLNFLGVSFDGPEEVHDRIRAQEGAFRKSTDGIRMLSEFAQSSGKKCPKVHVTSVIQQGNLDVLAEMPRVVAEAGADVLNLTLEIRTQELEGLGESDPRRYAMSEITFPRVDSDRLAQALRDTRAAADEAGVELRMPDMPDNAIVDYYSGKMPLGHFRCGSIWTDVIVGRTGDVYACWLKKLGSVREATLKAIWNGAEARAFRKNTRRGLYPPCVGCCMLIHKSKPK